VGVKGLFMLYEKCAEAVDLSWRSYWNGSTLLDMKF